MTTRSVVRRSASVRLEKIDSLLMQAYGAPEAELDNKIDPVSEAIYIILSFQTDLNRLRVVWAQLQSAYPNWNALARAPLAQIADVLRVGGLHRQKARILKRFLHAVRKLTGELSLEILREKTDQEAERILTRLPGLSWKGARCVLLYSLDRAVLPVDSNTFRIFKRAGILRSDAIYRRRSLHDQVQALVPAGRRRAFHVNLVIHGQRACLPTMPRCGICPIRTSCAMIDVQSSHKKIVTSAMMEAA